MGFTIKTQLAKALKKKRMGVVNKDDPSFFAHVLDPSKFGQNVNMQRLTQLCKQSRTTNNYLIYFI